MDFGLTVRRHTARAVPKSIGNEKLHIGSFWGGLLRAHLDTLVAIGRHFARFLRGAGGSGINDSTVTAATHAATAAVISNSEAPIENDILER